jgi:hypothetical protein
LAVFFGADLECSVRVSLSSFPNSEEFDVMRRTFSPNRSAVATVVLIATAVSAVADDTPPAAASPVASPAAEQPAGDAAAENEDNQAVQAMAAQLQSQLDGSKDELAAVAREIGTPLIASFRHGLTIARIDQRRRRMEEARVRLLETASQRADQREAMLAEMDGELEQVREQFADEAEICEAEQVAVIRAFRARLQALQAEEKRCRERAEQTTGVLADLRRESVKLERDSWLIGIQPALQDAAPELPDLDWIVYDRQAAKSPSDKLAPARPAGESLDEALTSIDQFRGS